MNISEFIMRFNAPEGCSFKQCTTCQSPFVYDEKHPISKDECMFCNLKLQELVKPS